MNFEELFVDPTGRTARGPFIGALIPLLLAAALYFFIVPGITGHWAMGMLLFPFFVLNARRLRDMGWTPLLLLFPALLIAVMIWLRATGSPVQYQAAMVAAIVAAGFALWGAVGKTAAAT